MIRRASPRLFAYVSLASVGLVVGLATQRTDILVLATPFVVFVLVGLATSDAPDVRAGVRVEPERSVEGEAIDVVVALESPTGATRVDVAMLLPPELEVRDGDPSRTMQLAPGEHREITMRVVSRRWGAYDAGALALRAHDRASLFVYELDVPATARVRFYPEQQRLRHLVRPNRTQLFAGDRVARRAAGEGIELADLRAFMPGDRPRDVNWRASARRRELWVTQRHPERSTDAVVFVDLFSEASMLPAVRAASTLVDSYLATRDRVGLVGFGGVVQWVRAGQGVRHLYRLLDNLLDARTFFSYAWKDIGVIPPHVLVPGSVVLAISPLEDDRVVTALVDLRARGYEVAIVELVPDLVVARSAESELDDVARRLWRLQRAHHRERLRQFGIAVVEWRAGDPVSSTMEVLWHVSEGRGAGRPA